MKPQVSIICLTYNHEKYIAEALESFVNQKTDFDFEVIIHDDASDDGTASIIREYQAKYPKIIKPVFQETNQYSKKDWGFINDLFENANGKYLATCEGDDYWTDVNKLQKQVDFMENNPECTLCFHPVNVIFENGEKESHIAPIVTDSSNFTVEELVHRNFIYTSSVMYRKIGSYDDLERKIMPQDLYLHLYHARHGKIACLNEVMSVYRRQPTGVWWSSDDDMNKIYDRFGILQVQFFSSVLEMFPDNKKIHKSVLEHFDYLLGQFIKMDDVNETGLAKETLKEFPDLVYFYITQTINKFNDYEAKRSQLYQELDAERHRLEKVLSESEDEITRLRGIEDEQSKQLDVFFGSLFCRLYYRVSTGVKRRLKKN